LKLSATWWRVLAIVGLAAASLTSAPDPRRVYSPHQKAFYADLATVQYILPGLTITVKSATIAANGTITVTYTLTDPNGLPLDTTGVTTPGPVSLSYVAAMIPNNEEDYTAYTTRAATGTVIATTQQPGADSGGVATSVGPGQYTYTFHTPAPAGFDVTATHTIGIYGSRDLTAYGLTVEYASATYNFVPNGSTVTHVHDIIETASCNTCHDQLSAHGGSRRGMNMCVLCHTPQNVDPNTGDTMDAKVFFHKIHMGASLPSVVAGTPYIPAINSHGSFNYSAVVFPADPEDPRRCTMCHSQTTGAAQATAYLTNPNRAACGACHDNVNFATGLNHPGGIQNDDTECANCHIAKGEMDFDASITGAHVAPTASTLLNGLTVSIAGITNGTAGKAPTVTFAVLDKNNNPIALSALGSISFTMAGPTTDYGYTIFGTNTSTPGYVTESAAGATCSASGTCTYKFTNIVPAAATGTYAIGVEARRTDTVPELINGATVQTSIEYGAPNVVSYFSVDGSAVAPRRTVVALANCNGCHASLQLHGTLRNNTEYCVLCHNPSNTDATTRPTATVVAQQTLPNQGIELNKLVHRIHFGPNAAADGAKYPYVVVGHGGSVSDFSQTLFPPLSPAGSAGDTKNCSMCHVNSSEQTLPTGLNPVVDPQGWINPIQRVAGACSGCHTSVAESSHFLANTNSLGEACTGCHSAGAAYAVDAVHAQY
jgi:OmcA/MtrC family decaheme c-type cytochrome